MKKNKLNKFSVPLGLLDYINPILYSITILTIYNNIKYYMDSPYKSLLLIGALISIIFGFVIPTGKVLVGLNIIIFKMPVSLVFIVNYGILLSGLMLLKYVFNFNLLILLLLFLIISILLYLIYKKSRKVNTIAVLTGMFGYLSIYISLITYSILSSLVIPVILYILAILLFAMLCLIGIRANLKDPKVHWVIEISNVICQLLVCIATLIIF